MLSARARPEVVAGPSFSIPQQDGGLRRRQVAHVGLLSQPALQLASARPRSFLGERVVMVAFRRGEPAMTDR